jgi:hypothetical protein
MPRPRLRFREFLLLIALGSLIAASYAIRARIAHRATLDDQTLRIHEAWNSARAWEYQIDHTKRMLAAIPPTSESWADEYELRLVRGAKDADIPASGKSLIVVARIGGRLEFRMFDGDGRMVVDLGDPGNLDAFQAELEGLWPPHELAGDEKRRIVTAVASIVDAGRARMKRYLGIIEASRAKDLAEAEERERMAGLRR